MDSLSPSIEEFNSWPESKKQAHRNAENERLDALIKEQEEEAVKRSLLPWPEPEEEKKPDPIPPFNPHIDGLVGEIADWITETAVKPQPILSLAAAIAFMGMLKSCRVRGRTDLRTNMYTLALAPTAAGKEHPQKAIRRLIGACGIDKHSLGEPTSGAALLTGLIKADKIGLLMIDEIGHYVSNITARNAGTYQKEIASYIIKLFGKASGIFEGKQYANEKINPLYVLDQPHLSCFGCSVAERMQEACGSAFVIDGFLNRWILFTTEARPKKKREITSYDPPESLIEKLKAWQEAYPLVKDKCGNPEPALMSFTPEAYDIFIAFDEEMEIKISQAAYPMDKLYARASEHVEKLSMILADGNNIGTPEINQAISIVEKSNRSIMHFGSMIADNESEADYIRVRELIREKGEIAKNELTRRTQRIIGGERRRLEIIASLLDSHIIAEKSTLDSKKVIYKWSGIG